MPAGEHRDRAGLAGWPRCARRVDAARQARDDDVAGCRRARARAARRNSARPPKRCASPTIATAGCATTAAVPATREQRRRGIDRLQRRRIVRLARARRSARRVVRRSLDLAPRPRRDGEIRTPAPPRRASSGSAFERRRGAAVSVDQRAEGARARHSRCGSAAASRGAAVGEARSALFADRFRLLPDLASVPASRRPMFSLCFHQSSAASTANTTAAPASPIDHRTTGVADAGDAGPQRRVAR